MLQQSHKVYALSSEQEGAEKYLRDRLRLEDLSHFE